MIILGGQLQIGDVIFGDAKIVALHHGAADIQIGEKVYSIGIDEEAHFRTIRKDDRYIRVVTETAGWLHDVQRLGPWIAPGAALQFQWNRYSEDELDEILADARRCLIVSGAVRGAI
jgi:hypothetical protein